MIKAAVEKMQLCQIHFYQKIPRKKVARVNAALFTYLYECVAEERSKPTESLPVFR